MDKNSENVRNGDFILSGGDNLIGFISGKKHRDAIKKIQRQLELENLRAAYWKMKFLQPDKDPVILGSQSDIDYIKN